MSKLYITDSEIRQVIDTLLNASAEGDVKAATALLKHFVPPVKPRAQSFMFKNLDDVRNSYFLGHITAEEVVQHVTALGLLADSATIDNVVTWNPEMTKYLESFNK